MYSRLVLTYGHVIKVWPMTATVCLSGDSSSGSLILGILASIPKRMWRSITDDTQGDLEPGLGVITAPPRGAGNVLFIFIYKKERKKGYKNISSFKNRETMTAGCLKQTWQKRHVQKVFRQEQFAAA